MFFFPANARACYPKQGNSPPGAPHLRLVPCMAHPLLPSAPPQSNITAHCDPHLSPDPPFSAMSTYTPCYEYAACRGVVLHSAPGSCLFLSVCSQCVCLLLSECGAAWPGRSSVLRCCLSFCFGLHVCELCMFGMTRVKMPFVPSCNSIFIFIFDVNHGGSRHHSVILLL